MTKKALSPQSDNSKNLGRDTIIYASSIAIDRLLGLALIPTLTRLLDKNDYGAWTQTSVTAGLLITIVLYALPTVIVRHQSSIIPPFTRKHSFNQIGLLCIIFCVTWCIALLSASCTVAHLVYGDSKYASLIPALLLLVIADAAIEFSIAWLRSIGAISVISGVVTARSAIKAGLVIFLINLNRFQLDQWLLIYSIGLVAFAIFIILLTRRTINFGANNSGSHQAPSLHLQIIEATPLVALSILTMLSGYLDRYLLTAWFGLKTIAVYAAAASLAAIPSMVHSILGFTVFPEMSRQWTNGRRANATRLMNQAVVLYLFFSLPISFFVTAFGSWILPKITTNDYEISSAIFILLSISVTSLGIQQILTYGLLIGGRGFRLLVIAALTVTVNFAFAFLLVPKTGIHGAAFAAAAANLAALGMTTIEVNKLLRWQFPWKKSLSTAIKAALLIFPTKTFIITSGTPTHYIFPILILGGLIYLIADWKSDSSTLRNLTPRLAHEKQ